MCQTFTKVKTKKNLTNLTGSSATVAHYVKGGNSVIVRKGSSANSSGTLITACVIPSFTQYWKPNLLKVAWQVTI